MKKYLSILLVFSFLTGCVSKKKYTALKNRYDQNLNDKSGLEDVLNKVAVENDSLRKQNDLLDSLFRSEREKNLAAGSMKSAAATYSKTKAPAVSKTVEYEKKAIYFYNLPNYIYWPKTVKADKFLIGIYGESNMNAALAANVYGKKIKDLPGIVEPYSPAPGKFYHMVFVAESKQQEFNRIRKELGGQPVLLVSENPYFDKAGAHVCFYLEGDKVKFKVNKKAIEKSGLNVSEQLIKLSGDN